MNEISPDFHRGFIFGRHTTRQIVSCPTACARRLDDTHMGLDHEHKGGAMRVLYMRGLVATTVLAGGAGHRAAHGQAPSASDRLLAHIGTRR